MLTNLKHHFLPKSKKTLIWKQGLTEQNPLTSLKNEKKHSNAKSRGKNA